MMKSQLPLAEAVAVLRTATEMCGVWKQVDLARRLRVSQKHMNLVWKGHVMPNLDLLEDWARLLGFELVVTVEVRAMSSSAMHLMGGE